jgi:hypothetical protein
MNLSVQDPKCVSVIYRLIERAKLRRNYVALLKRARRAIFLREGRGIRFKASTQKKDSLLRFLPINLHVEELHVATKTKDTMALSKSKANAMQLGPRPPSPPSPPPPPPPPTSNNSTSNNHNHNSTLTSSSSSICYHTTTVGAFAAHVYKFKHGGLHSCPCAQ